MIVELDHNSSTPLHQQAEEILRKMIADEEYRNGKLLPNEIELSKRLNISRNTLRQAINKLVFEGHLIRKKGYGTCVAPQDVMSNAHNWMSFSQEMAMQGQKVQNFELHLSWKKPPKEAADFFGVSQDDKLICLERLRGKPDSPFVFFTSFFNPDIPMSISEDMSTPLYEILFKKYGIKVKTSKEQISAKAANEELAEKLGLSDGDPILVRKRFVLDDKNVPIEYNIGYYRGDSFTYSIECTNE